MSAATLAPWCTLDNMMKPKNKNFYGSLAEYKETSMEEQDPRTLTQMRERLKMIQQQMDAITSEVGMKEFEELASERKIVKRGIKRAERARKSK